MMKPTQLCDEPQRRHIAGEYINLLLSGKPFPHIKVKG